MMDESNAYLNSIHSKRQAVKQRICLIAPHFGTLPPWILLTLSTFSRNADVDLLIITDQKIDHFQGYPNISFICCTLNAFATRCSQAVGSEVKLRTGYKICDLRPAFGVIFGQEIKGYDYWGHIDLDTFWGNINILLEPILEKEYDVICGYPYHVGGPFCLYRNTDLLNSLFKENPHYIDAFKSLENVDFDEIGINVIQYQGFDWTVRQAEDQGKIKVYRAQQFYLQDCDSSWWIMETRKAIAQAGLMEYSTDLRPFEFGTGLWKRGKITGLTDVDGKEYAFYHFLDGKRRLFQPFKIRGCEQIKSFTVGLDGIHLTYYFGVWGLRHDLEKIIIKGLRILIYDLGPLRHKLNLKRQTRRKIH